MNKFLTQNNITTLMKRNREEKGINFDSFVGKKAKKAEEEEEEKERISFVGNDRVCFRFN